MRIGIIGIGSFTLELAIRSAEAGYSVTIHNPRGNSLIKDVIGKIGSNVKSGSLDEAAQSELILLFIPKDDLENIIKNLPDMSGKVILHTSGLIFDPQSLLSGIANAMTYKITASLLPEAKVVKLFNPVQINANHRPYQDKGKEEIFFIADHSDSRNCVRSFLKALSYTPMDLSGKLHLNYSQINQKVHFNPFSSSPFKNTLN
ncbi:NAD(P)-binding domain-containing protein [Flavobacterium endoglycinae]|uniref:NAD(P)-binding domain-containing protein n=1 Tax=Flavobacterium endoglycinae TaxID=2816357 RepID=A0ABX7QGS0_9FLAO|nr:NAD(P)-binding domain-containing protein [Flavobacterium endoglycinae]QSW89576.1 NAD(P)-binding domain-containing protein [Flavobacterium endoglycinae]